MSEKVPRATTATVGSGDRGVAYAFWERVERERVRLGWTKTQLSAATARYTPTERPLPRATIDELQRTTRAPMPRIVHALADALGIPRPEAERLAGLVPTEETPTPTDSQVRAAIEGSKVYDDRQKKLLLDLVDTLDQANRGPSHPNVQTASPSVDTEEAH